MGIKNFNSFLKKKNSKILNRYCDLSVFKHKVFSVDIIMYIFKYVKSLDNGLIGMYNLYCYFLESGIIPIIVYEGKALPEKKMTHDKRNEDTVKAKKRINQYKTDLKNYYETGQITQLLQECNPKKSSSDDSIALQRFLSVGINDTGGQKTSFDPQMVVNKIARMEKQQTPVTPEVIEMSKVLAKAFGFTTIVAENEAERTCAQLVKGGIADGVITDDSDILCYNIPIYISNINTYMKNCKVVVYEEILYSLNFENHKQFVDYCIMCGTDYNDNIPNIGNSGSYNFIMQYKSIENIAKHNTNLDISILKHERSRELFNPKPITHLQLCKRKPDILLIRDILYYNKCYNANMDTIKNILFKGNITFNFIGEKK